MSSTDPPPPTIPKPLAPPPAAAAAKHSVKLQIRDPNYPPKKRPLAPAPAVTPKRRRCCTTTCCCLIWLIISLLILTLIVAATCGVVWILYDPQRPKFTVASLKLGNLNLTGNLDTDAAGRLFTSGNLTVSVRNPNSKIMVLYGETAMSVYSPSRVMIANSTFRSFASAPGNSTVMRFVFRSWRTLDLESARGLRSDLTRKGEMGLRVELETKMGVQIGKWKSRKIGIKVTCVGLRVKIPKHGTTSSAADGASCTVDLSIKILGFTF